MIGELTPGMLLMAGLGVGVVLSWMTGAFGRGGRRAGGSATEPDDRFLVLTADR